MTLAQSRLLLSSGNKFTIFVFALFLLLATSSCDALKPAQKTDGSGKNNTGELEPVVGENKKNNTDSEDNTDIVRVVSKPDEPDTLVWSPSEPTDIGGGGVKNPDTPVEPVDTIVIKKNDDGNDGSIPPGGITKGNYNLAVLLPLYTDEFKETGKVPSKAERSINYYEGMLLGFRRLEGEGANLTVNVYDTKVNSIESLKEYAEIKNADLIIGPVSAGDVQVAAKFAKERQQLLVSLNSSEGLTAENPYFIQASPSMAAHSETIVQYFHKKYSNSKIFLLGRNEETASFAYFQEANKTMADGANVNSLMEYIVTGSSSNYDIRGFKDNLSKADTNVIVIPSSNQGFVYSMIRELSLIRTTYPIIVVGMPSWDDFTRIDADYYQKLNVHISHSAYINNSNPNIQNFKRSFFNEYGAAPTQEAYKGYDVALYFGRMLKKYGTGMLREFSNNNEKMLHAELRFEPSYTIETEGWERPHYQINQFENKAVHILRYNDYEFYKVN